MMDEFIKSFGHKVARRTENTVEFRKIFDLDSASVTATKILQAKGAKGFSVQKDYRLKAIIVTFF